MMQSFHQLLETAADIDLIEGIFHGLVGKYGNEIHAKKGPGEARVVTLSHLARGIVGNGGFRYLFEGDFPGDPGFRMTLHAYETIGARSAVSAFKKALAVFPDSRLPKNIGKRLEIFLRTPYSRRQKIDQRFWNADEQITKQLAQYIRSHGQAFLEMKLRLPLQERRSQISRRRSRSSTTRPD